MYLSLLAMLSILYVDIQLCSLQLAIWVNVVNACTMPLSLLESSN